MHLFIDSADISEIKKLNDYFPIDGVTTNPSIIVKEQKPFLTILRDIRSIIGDEKLLFVQIIAEKAEDIIEEALYLSESVSGNTVVKIPVTAEGIKAIKILKGKGIRTLATTVYTPMNAYMAAKAGADYVAPYVNRIDNLTGNGVSVVSEIKQIFTQFNFSCEVIAASFKNVQQISNACLVGSDGVTVSPDLIEAFVGQTPIGDNVNQFKAEWSALYGKESIIIM